MADDVGASGIGVWGQMVDVQGAPKLGSALPAQK